MKQPKRLQILFSIKPSDFHSMFPNLYHYFEVSPCFFGREDNIEITEKEVISRNGYRFMDIKDFKVIHA